MKRLVSGVSLAVSTCVLGGNVLAQSQASEELEEVIVTGIRGSLQRSADIKQEAPAIVDAISAEDIGDFPDANIADSLQRITGVQISRDRGGEGRFVSIRGLGSQFNMATLNGRVLATDNAGRDFSFDVMPSEALQTVAVYKSPTASLPEGSIGGLIQMELLNPLQNPGFQLSTSVGGFYDDATEDATPRASVVVSNTFAGERIGAFLGATYYKRNWRSDTYESFTRSGEVVDANGMGELYPDTWGDCDEDDPTVPCRQFRPSSEYSRIGRGAFPGITSYQVKFGERERIGVVGGLRFEPSDTLVTSVDAFYSDFETPEYSYSYNINYYSNDGWGRFTNATYEEYPGEGETQYILNSFDLTHIPVEIGNDNNVRRAETYMVGWNTKWQTTDRLSTNFDVAYSEADRPNKATDDYYTVAGIPDANIHYDGNSRVARITCTLPDGRSCYEITNDEIGLHFMEKQGEETNDTATSVKLDFDYQVDAGALAKVKTGLFYSDREKTRNLYKSPDGNPAAGVIGTCALCGFDTTLGEAGITALVPFPNGGYGNGNPFNGGRLWPTLNGERLWDAVVAARGQEFYNANYAAVRNLRGSSEIQEEISGAYVQFDLSGERWDANVGVRYVQTDVTAKGFSQNLLQLNPIPNSTNFSAVFSDTVPVTDDNDYDNVLPSLNFTYRLADNVLVRAAASQAITRPTFSDLGVNVNWETNSLPLRLDRLGNPDLETIESDALDVSLEWYNDSGSSASFAVFYKDITNFVAVDETTELHLGQEFVVTRRINGDEAELLGVELAVQQIWENGFGVMANYTYVDNEALITVDNEQIDTQLDGVSENTFNVSGFYEAGGVSLRLSYNYRDEFVDCGVCGIGNRPRTTAESAFLDFSGSYAINDILTVYLDAFNLTEEEQHQYYFNENFTHYYEQFPRRFEFGVRAKF